ncbi:hypothetical protein Y032_0381g355 [Ancylostoma ceylanicum]|uniref:Uncharacterized protein n=1 Tax=Ancylostoma ceylanicum TaxID=53326 RepID=A0A016RT78_9BILA|nr:hypothetical protein Y032_0381g355 [Ancylostoma ceylanicum]
MEQSGFPSPFPTRVPFEMRVPPDNLDSKYPISEYSNNTGPLRVSQLTGLPPLKEIQQPGFPPTISTQSTLSQSTQTTRVTFAFLNSQNSLPSKLSNKASSVQPSELNRTSPSNPTTGIYFAFFEAGEPLPSEQ